MCVCHTLTWAFREANRTKPGVHPEVGLSPGNASRIGGLIGSPSNWVAAEEFKLSYHNPETILFGIYPHHGTLI